MLSIDTLMGIVCTEAVNAGPRRCLAINGAGGQCERMTHEDDGHRFVIADVESGEESYCLSPDEVGR